MSRKLKFQTGIEIIDKKLYDYNTSCKIIDMLNDFISKANVDMEKDNCDTRFDLNNYSFMFRGKIINKDDFLNKTVGNVFKNTTNSPIQVRETKEVIGGKN